MANDAWTIVLGSAGLLVNGAALAFISIQVSLARRQAAKAQESEAAEVLRRRKESTASFLVSTLETRRGLRRTLPDDFDKSAVAEFVQQVIDGRDPVLEDVLRAHLSVLETLALCVSTGIYDFETARRMSGARIEAVANNYHAYIEYRRERTGVLTLYEEIQWFARELDAHRAGLPPDRRMAMRKAQPVASWNR